MYGPFLLADISCAAEAYNALMVLYHIVLYDIQHVELWSFFSVDISCAAEPRNALGLYGVTLN